MEGVQGAIKNSFNLGDGEAFIDTYILNLFVSCVCAVSFTILLSLDAWNALKRKAYWFPGQALVLSAPTIQLLSFIDNLNLSVDSDDTCYIYRVLRRYQLVLNTRRIMICVIIGYLLPGMVSSSFTNLGSNIGALALSIIVHMASEVYFVHQVSKQGLSTSCSASSRSSSVIKVVSPFPSPSPSPSPPFWNYEVSSYFWFWELSYNTWLKVSWATLFTVIILLVCLLGCAVLAGKSIRNICSRKVPLALSCCCDSSEGGKLQCHSIGDHVLKCWIVVRASQPDYIMARSVFSSFVGLVITVCIVFLAVDWIEAPPPLTISQVIPLFIQFLFILIGWIIISLRWVTGIMYFSRDLRSLFQWEDFWTRNFVELKANLNAHCRERLFREKRLPKRAKQESGIASSIIAIRLYSLFLTMALCLQKLMVSLSKACWCLSEIVFRMIRPVFFSREKNVLLSGSDISPTNKNPFFRYKEALEIIRMPGEIAFSLWIANESAFKKVEKQMEEGSKKGKDSSQLIKLKVHRTEDPLDEAAISVEEEEYSVEEEEYFQQIGKTSWKMKAVSLIRFIIFYYEDAVSTDIDDAIQAYCQAWPLMDIVDTSNPEANLVSQAADKEFDALEDIWKQHVKMKSVENPKDSHFKKELSKLVKVKIEKGQLCQLCEEGDLKLFSNEEEEKALKDKNYKDRFHDDKEWIKRSAAKSSLYKTRKAFNLDRDHSMARLNRLLANVIFSCMDKEVDKALIKNCNKWAVEGNENDIFEAAFIAGIAKGVKIGEGEVQPKDEGSEVCSLPDEMNAV